jgi:hypothetical protein
MAVDAVSNAATPAASSSSSNTSASDMSQFEQAFAQYMPQAASFVLMSIAQDAVQEMMQAGDDNANAPGPGD